MRLAALPSFPVGCNANFVNLLILLSLLTSLTKCGQWDSKEILTNKTLNSVLLSNFTSNDASFAWPVDPTIERQWIDSPPTFLHPSCRRDVAICSGVHYTATVMAGMPPAKDPLLVKPIAIKAKSPVDPSMPVAYSFFNGTPEMFHLYFVIDHHTGEVRQTKLLQADSKEPLRQFQMHIMAKPAYGNAMQASFALLTIDVQSPFISHHDPVVVASSLVGYVEEGSSIGTFVRSGMDKRSVPLRVTVTDLDLQSGMPPAIYQYMLSGNGATYFAIDEQGHVYVNSLKLKTLTDGAELYELMVRTREVGTVPIRTSEALSIRIHLIHVSKSAAPVFLSKSYYATAYAGLDQQSLIKVKAVSRNDGSDLSSLVYRIVSVSNGGERLFRYNAETNTLLAVAPLASNTNYRVLLEAADSSKRVVNTVIVINVIEPNQIQPIRELAPVQSSSVRPLKSKMASAKRWPISATFNITISEAVQPDTLVMTLMAENSPPDRTLYRLVDGNHDQSFRIDPNDGRIFTAKRLDRETKSSYRLIIEVTSFGVTTFAEISVSIGDVNDNAPNFDQAQSRKFTLDRSAPAGTLIGRLQAIDTDSGRNGQISYSIFPANPYFNINSNDGSIIRTGASLDEKSAHRFTVVASDHGTPSFQSSADVEVEIANDRVLSRDSLPIFLANYTVAIDENAPVTELTRVKAIYPNGFDGPITYALVDGDRTLFSIDSKSGAVSTLAPLDAERQNRYNLIVGTEQNPSSQPPARTSLTIVVQDLNDNAPIFQTASYVATISESMPAGSSLLQVAATDRDKTSPNNVIKYRLIGDEEAKQFFKIDESTGLVTIARSILGTGQFKFTLSVEARDVGTPSRSSAAAITVNVQPISNVPYVAQSTWQPPLVGQPITFSNKNFSTTVYESIPPPHFVMTLPMRTTSTVWEPLYCSIVSGNIDDAFKVKTGSGGLCEIETRQKLDREKMEKYNLEIIARVQPLSGVNYTTTTWVQVEVLDQNDNRPVFEFDENNSLSEGTYFAVVDETAGRLSHVLTVKATDQDSEKNQLVTYSLVRADPDSVHFLIDRDTGELQTRRELAKVTSISSSFFYFRVQAADSPAFGTSLISEAYVAVNVISDLNRFVVTLKDWSPRHGENNIRKLKKALAEIGHQRVRRCPSAFLERIDRTESSVDLSKTVNLVFVPVNEQTKRVCRTADVHQIFQPESVNQLIASLQSSLRIVDVKAMVPLAGSIFGRRLQTSEIILIIVGCFILTICIIGIFVLCYYWSRSGKRRNASQKAMLYGVRPPFCPTMLSPTEKEYETQMLELAVPEDIYGRPYRSYFNGDDAIYAISHSRPNAVYSTRNSVLSHVYIPPPDYGDRDEINLSFLTADDFKSGLKIAANELAKQGLKSIMEINKYKGDVVGKANYRRRSSNSVKSNVAHSARTGFAYRWSEGRIPYVLSRKYSNHERALIARAMQTYHEKSCIRFIPRTTERDYLSIGKYDGCFSDVGRTGGAQQLSLDDGCLVYRTILHELMHAVGFWHEHERPDRDDYVEILWRNIRSGAQNQFSTTDPAESNVFNERYDYRSIMHYDSMSFSRNGRPTMIAKEPGMTNIMGTSLEFSPSDLRRLNQMYTCSRRPVPNLPVHPIHSVHDNYDEDDGRERELVLRPHPRPPPSRPDSSLNIKLPFGLCYDFGRDCPSWKSLCHQPFISIPLKFACAKTCGAC